MSEASALFSLCGSHTSKIIRVKEVCYILTSSEKIHARRAESTEAFYFFLARNERHARGRSAMREYGALQRVFERHKGEQSKLQYEIELQVTGPSEPRSRKRLSVSSKKASQRLLPVESFLFSVMYSLTCRMRSVTAGKL